jgi:cardiolipin synthase A/B
VLTRSRRPRTGPHALRRSGGSTSRAAAGALRLAHSMGSAFGNRRVLDTSSDALLPYWIGALALIALVAAVWPRVVAWPLAALVAWIAIGLCARYLRMRRRRTKPPLPEVAPIPRRD